MKATPVVLPWAKRFRGWRITKWQEWRDDGEQHIREHLARMHRPVGWKWWWLGISPDLQSQTNKKNSKNGKKPFFSPRRNLNAVAKQTELLISPANSHVAQPGWTIVGYSCWWSPHTDTQYRLFAEVHWGSRALLLPFYYFLFALGVGVVAFAYQWKISWCLKKDGTSLKTCAANDLLQLQSYFWIFKDARPCLCQLITVSMAVSGWEKSKQNVRRNEKIIGRVWYKLSPLAVK